MPNSKMMLQAELDRPRLPVFDAPALAPAIEDVAPSARGRAVAARRSRKIPDAGVVASRRLRDRTQCLLSTRLGARGLRACARTRRRQGAARLGQPRAKTLIGLLPVVSAWRALKLPIPVFVAWQAYAPLTTPLLDRDAAEQAAAGLLDAAQLAGAGAILFQNLAQDGPAAAAIAGALARRNIRAHVHDTYERARLDATRRCRGLAARRARTEETERASPPAQSPGRPRPGRIPHGALAGRDRAGARDLSGAGIEGLESRSRHGARPARRRPPLHPRRRDGARSAGTVRDRDLVAWRQAGGLRTPASPSAPRLFLQDRDRRERSAHLARRAAHARSDPALLRGRRRSTTSIPPPTPIIR